MERLELAFDESFLQSDALSHLDDRLNVARASIPGGFEEVLRRRAVYVNAHTTTAIEGNPLSEEEAKRVSLEGADPDRPPEVEVANIEEAYELIDQIGPDPSVSVDGGLIRTFNSIVLKGLTGHAADNRGRYRLIAAAVQRENSSEIVYYPPAPELVPHLMSRLILDIEEWSGDHPPAVASALVHFGLVSIHPFEDGNGRTARLAAHLLLNRPGSGAALLALNEAIWDQRQEYYRVLRQTQGLHFRAELDVTSFLEFHTAALLSAAEDLAGEARRLAEVLDWFKHEFTDEFKERQALGYSFLYQLGRPISSATYAEVTGSSVATANRDLRDLVARGVLERTGRGKGSRYQPTGKVPSARSKREGA